MTLCAEPSPGGGLICQLEVDHDHGHLWVMPDDDNWEASDG